MKIKHKNKHESLVCLTQEVEYLHGLYLCIAPKTNKFGSHTSIFKLRSETLMGVVAQIIQQDSTKRNVDTESINPGLMRQTNISKGIPKALLFAMIEVHKNILK